MKKIANYVNTMYRSSFIALCIGLTALSVAAIVLAVTLRCEILAGESDVIYRYPKMIKELLIRSIASFPIALLIDLNERRS